MERQQLGDSGCAVFVHAAEVADVAEITVVRMIDGREDRQHAVAVLHQPAMVLRAGGHALFLRVVRDLSDGGGQRGRMASKVRRPV